MPLWPQQHDLGSILIGTRSAPARVARSPAIRITLLLYRKFAILSIGSKSPVGDRRGDQMCGGDIGLGQGQIFPHHVHRCVPQRHLQGVGVASVSQEIDRECVTEAMRICSMSAEMPAGALTAGRFHCP